MALKIECCFLAAFQIERNQSARESALLSKDAQLFRVFKQSRVIDSVNLMVSGQALGDPLSILALAVHAQMHRRKPGVQNPALIGLQDITEEAALAADLFH